MGTVVIYDGEVLSPDEARVSIFDHGFLFGDSVYDVVRTRHEAPFLLDEHLGRLRRSAAEIHSASPTPTKSCEARYAARSLWPATASPMSGSSSPEGWGNWNCTRVRASGRP